MNKRNIKNKIGYVDNKYLHIKKDGGHYVYIRKINKNGTCDVNTFTSLVDKKGSYNFNKLKQVKSGNTYSIPIYHSNFPLWTGVTHKPIKNVPLSKIKKTNKKIKRRHYFYIGKYCNK